MRRYRRKWNRKTLLMIEVRELTTPSELRAFVTFPFSLFKGNSCWVPPIINDELEVFDREKNPVFENAEIRFFMAWSDGIAVGRVAAIFNWIEIRQQKKAKIRFGWFDAIDDVRVTEALLGKVVQLGREKNLEYMEGPVGFSNMDKAGLLTEGFDQPGTMITWYSKPYYADHFKKLGFEKASEWVEFKIEIPKEGPSEKVVRFSDLILKKYNLQLIKFSSKKEVIDRADEMFELINQTYNNLSTFVPIQPRQVAYYKQKYLRFLHPDFVTCVGDENGKMVAFAITMPSFTGALQKANGSLFPFGWFHLLKALKYNQKADFYLIGVKPELQNKGITAIIFKEMNEMFNRKGITTVETNPELEENRSIQALWNSYDSQLHKRRQTYRKSLNGG